TLSSTVILSTLSLHDALPISSIVVEQHRRAVAPEVFRPARVAAAHPQLARCNLGKVNQAESHAVHARAPPWEGRGNHVVGICSRSEEHTSELQSRFDLVCRLL